MEEIQKFLAEDEEILWSQRYKNNLIDINIWMLIFVICISLTSLLNLYWIITSKKLPIFTFIFFWILNFVIVILLIKNISNIKKMKKVTQASLRELYNYHNSYILTNKRWIQRNYDYSLRVNEEEYSKEELKKRNDIVFVNLDYVRSITISKFEYNVEFSMFHKDDIFDKNHPYSWIGFDLISKSSEQNFINQITNKLQFQMIKDGDFARYYHKI